MPGASNDTVGNNCSCPDQVYYTGVGGVCPLGHYCPVGSPAAIPCVPGSYADVISLSECKVCPQGFYCLANASDFTSTPCPTGK